MFKLCRTRYVPSIHDAILATLHEHLHTNMLFSTPFDAHHLQVDKFLLILLFPDDDGTFTNQASLTGYLTREHPDPVAFISRQAERLVQTHLVKNRYAFLAFTDAHTTSHLLQVLGERQRGTCQLNELHFGEVNAFAQDIYIYADFYLVGTIILNQPFTFSSRRLRLYPAAADPMLLVILRDVSCMFAVDGIDDALLAIHILLVGIVQMFDALRHIHHRSHLSRLVVPVSPSLLQASDLLHHRVIRTGRDIVEVREPPLVDELLNGPRHQYLAEQLSKASMIHPARRSRQSEEPCRRPSVPQHLVRLSHSMMCLVDYNKGKILIQSSSRQRLNARHLHLFRLIDRLTADNHAMLNPEFV